jgi:hypothetical protein
MYPQLKFRDFEPERLVRYQPEQKKSSRTSTNPGGLFHEIHIAYRYRDGSGSGSGGDIVSPLLVQMPPLYSPEGIVYKQGVPGVPGGPWVEGGASLPTTFNVESPDVMDFIRPRAPGQDSGGGFMEELYYACIDRVNANRHYLPSLKDHPDLTTIFTHPIGWHRDSAGRIDLTRSPKKYIPLVRYGVEGQPGYRATQFHSPIKNGHGGHFPYDWKSIVSKETHFTGVLRIKKIYIGGPGGKISLQMELESVQVDSIKPICVRLRQQATLDEKYNDEESRTLIRSQLRDLRLLPG